MIFISLGRFRKKPTKETIANTNKTLKEFKEHGNKVLGFYYTLGRYDAVLIFEAPNEKVAMELQAEVADAVANETMVAVPREEAIKFL
jgi:uncharacterized protein with GYD domain